VSNWFLTFS